VRSPEAVHLQGSFLDIVLGADRSHVAEARFANDSLHVFVEHDGSLFSGKAVAQLSTGDGQLTGNKTRAKQRTV
jgi:hypothetical protein